MIDLRQLRYFVCIVEQGSISRAAEVLRVAQPALSLHLRNMEAHLNTALLHRSSKGVDPTEAGQTLLRHARNVLAQMVVAEEEIRGHAREPTGTVRLGLPGTIGQRLTVPLIKDLRHRYPGIRLCIAEAMSGFVLDWLRDGRIDLAVLYGEGPQLDIAAEHLFDEELLLFGLPSRASQDRLPSGAKPLVFSAVLDLPLILPAEGHGLRALIQRQAAAAGLTVTTVLDVDSFNSIKTLVQEGLGYSILPRHSIAEDLRHGRLQSWSVTAPQLLRSVFLAHSKARPITNAMTAAFQLTRERMLADFTAGKLLIPETGGPVC